MISLRLENLQFAFDGGVPVVDGVSLELHAGEFFGLLGPSGSGKSTLLRLIGGYLAPQAGAVWMGDQEITGLAPERREMGMVFQNYALFPHLNAAQNVEFGLRVRRVPRILREAKAREMLAWVGLNADEIRRLPTHLSGGQQQRVALARALVFSPGLLMLDEPFANLDRSLRERLREDVRQIQRRFGITTILVTHDRDEAFALCDRMGVLQQGKLLQTGTPEQIYRQPDGTAVARLLGHRNVLEPDAARFCGLDGPVVLWPEKLLVRGETGALRGVVSRVTFTGSDRVVTIQLDAGPLLDVRCAEDSCYQRDERVSLEIPPAAVTRLRSA